MGTELELYNSDSAEQRRWMELVLEEREKVDAERDLRYAQRFRDMLEAGRIQAAELLRRLSELNHAHELAREKERDFIGREAFDTFVQRTSDDFATLRGEITVTKDAVAETKGAAAEALATALSEQNKTNEIRFGKVENVQAKMIGGLIICTFVVPIITGLIVYLLTRHAVPLVSNSPAATTGA